MKSDSNLALKKAIHVPRSATKPWRDVFHNLSNVHKSGFSTRDLKDQVEKLNIQISPNSVQVKLARYVSSGVLRKLARNRFQITPKGTIFFKILEDRNQEERMD